MQLLCGACVLHACTHWSVHRLLHFFAFIKRNLLLLVGEYQPTASVLHWGRPDALWQIRKCRDFAQQWAAHPSIMKWSWLYPWFTLAPVPLCFPLPLFNRFTHLFTWHAFPPVTSSTAQLASRVGCLIKTTATGHWFYTLGDAGSFFFFFYWYSSCHGVGIIISLFSRTGKITFTVHHLVKAASRGVNIVWQLRGCIGWGRARSSFHS